VSAGRAPLFTWSRVGIACSIGLVAFGVLDAALPHRALSHPSLPRASLSKAPAPKSPGPHVINPEPRTTGTLPVSEGSALAAQQVAQRFTTAIDTTDPAHPDGNTAEWAPLAPGLTVPRGLVQPEAWVAEDRKTTVVLDPPGPVVIVGVRKVVVAVTGQMIVTTNVGPPDTVPVDERISLRLVRSTGTASAGRRALPDGVAGGNSAAHWVVTDVGVGR